jgi:hypothetical protein
MSLPTRTEAARSSLQWHRAKTHRGWTHVRNRDGSYTWTSPYGPTYTVDPRGIVTRH